MTSRSSLWRLRRQYLHVFASAACVIPFVSYVLSDLGWRPGGIGLATGLLGLTAAAAGPVWGALDDRTGRAFGPALSASAVAAAAVFLAVSWPPLDTPWLVCVALGLFGATAGPLEPLLTTSLIARRIRRLGGFRAYGSLGWVVGLALGGLAITLAVHRPGSTFLLAAALAVTGPRSRRTVPAAPKHARPALRPPWRAVLRVMMFTWPVAFALEPMVQLSAGWAHADLHAGPFVAAAPLGVSAALELPAFALVDRLADRRTPRAVALLGLPPLALAWALLAALPNRFMLFAVQPLVAVTFALWFVGQARLLAAAVEPNRLASAQTLGSLLSLGVIGPLGSIIGGAVAQHSDYRVMFEAMSAVAGVGLLINVVWSSRSVSQSRTRPSEPSRTVAPKTDVTG